MASSQSQSHCKPDEKRGGVEDGGKAAKCARYQSGGRGRRGGGGGEGEEEEEEEEEEEDERMC